MSEVQKAISFLKANKLIPYEVVNIPNLSQLQNDPKFQECEELSEIITKIKNTIEEFEDGICYAETKVGDAFRIIGDQSEESKKIYKKLESVADDFIEYINQKYGSNLANAVIYAQHHCIGKEEIAEEISYIVFQKYKIKFVKVNSDQFTIEHDEMSKLWKYLDLVPEAIENNQVKFKGDLLTRNIKTYGLSSLDESGLVINRQIMFSYDDTIIKIREVTW